MQNELMIKQDSFPAASENGLFFNVEKFAHAQRVAKMLASSTMMPDQFRGDQNIGNVMIMLNYADRIGADPFMLAQGMYIVHGKPGLEGKLVIALINACGRFDPVEFEEIGDLSTPKADDDGCIAFAKDLKSGKTLKGPKVDWRTVKSEGWYGKGGSKWKTMAPLMFRYRAATFFARVYCPDVLLGMQTKEELLDVTDMRSVGGQYEPVQARQTLADKVKAHTAPATETINVQSEYQEESVTEDQTPSDDTSKAAEVASEQPAQAQEPSVGPETKIGDIPGRKQIKMINAMIRERNMDRAGVKLAMRRFEVHPKGSEMFRPFDVDSTADITVENVKYFEAMLDELTPHRTLVDMIHHYGDVNKIQDFEGFVKVALRDGKNKIDVKHWYLLQRHQVDRILKMTDGKCLLDDLAAEAVEMQNGGE